MGNENENDIETTSQDTPRIHRVEGLPPIILTHGNLMKAIVEDVFQYWPVWDSVWRSLMSADQFAAWTSKPYIDPADNADAQRIAQSWLALWQAAQKGSAK